MDDLMRSQRQQARSLCSRADSRLSSAQTASLCDVSVFQQILYDANINRLVRRMCIMSRPHNTGQTCTLGFTGDTFVRGVVWSRGLFEALTPSNKALLEAHESRGLALQVAH